MENSPAVVEQSYDFVKKCGIENLWLRSSTNIFYLHWKLLLNFLWSKYELFLANLLTKIFLINFFQCKDILFKRFTEIRLYLYKTDGK